MKSIRRRRLFTNRKKVSQVKRTHRKRTHRKGSRYSGGAPRAIPAAVPVPAVPVPAAGAGAAAAGAGASDTRLQLLTERLLGQHLDESVATIPERVEVKPGTIYEGNITHDNGHITLSNYNEMQSIGVGWSYGSRFGTLNLYMDTKSQDGAAVAAPPQAGAAPDHKLEGLMKNISDLSISQETQVKKGLFVNKIDVEVDKSVEHVAGPWNKMVYNFKLDTVIEGVDATEGFLSLLQAYYVSKMLGETDEKKACISFLRKNFDRGVLTSDKLITGVDDKYTNDLGGHGNHKGRYEDFPKPVHEVLTLINDETWGVLENRHLDILNAHRLKQEIVYNNFTEIFSEYDSQCIPFNLEYYKYGTVGEGGTVHAIKIINDLLGRVNVLKGPDSKGYGINRLNQRLYNSLGAIWRNLSMVGVAMENPYTSGVYHARTKNKPLAEVDGERVGDTTLTTFKEDLEYNKLMINSLLYPNVLGRLLLINCLVEYMILIKIDASGNIASIGNKKKLKVGSLKKKDGDNFAVGGPAPFAMDTQEAVIEMTLENDTILTKKCISIRNGGEKGHILLCVLDNQITDVKHKLLASLLKGDKPDSPTPDDIFDPLLTALSTRSGPHMEEHYNIRF